MKRLDGIRYSTGAAAVVAARDGGYDVYDDEWTTIAEKGRRRYMLVCKSLNGAQATWEVI